MMIKKTAKFFSIAALFLIPLFALIVVNTNFFPFITGKAFYFRILVEIAFAGWLILSFLDAKYRPKWTPITIGVTVFAVITLIADLLGVNPIRSFWSNFERMEGWITIIHLWAFYITATGIFGYGEEGRRLWHRWINMQLAVAIYVAAYGLLQLSGKALIHQGSSRIDASLGNAAYMAVYMLWNTGLAAYMFCVARAKRIANAGFLKWAYPVIAVLFAYEIWQTATRGTILGLIGGILLALFLYAILAKGESKKKRGIAGGIILLIILIGVIFWTQRDSSFVKNNEVMNRMASISWTEAQGQARNYIWPMAIKGFTERPILGWGQENFNYIFNANYNPRMWSQEQWFDRAHSVYLDWLSAAGILGLLAYLALYVLLFVSVWKSGLTMAEKCILTGVIAGYAIHNFFVFDNIASYIMFFAVLGFASSFRKAEPIKFLGDKPMPADAVSHIAAPAVLVVLIAVIYIFNARPIQANRGLIVALTACAGPTPVPALFEKALNVRTYVANQEIREQLFSCANRVLVNDEMPGELKQDFFDLTRRTIKDQIAATPFEDTRIYALAGSYLNMVAQFGQALPLLEKAHELSPGKQTVDVELATALLNTGQVDRATDILRADYEAVPENTLVSNLYALALVVQGNEATARKLFGDDAAIFDSLQMAQAYTMGKQPQKAITVYKKFLTNTPNDLNASVQLARLQYEAGLKTDAIKTFRDLQKAYPQYKDAIEAAIKAAGQ